MSISFDASPEGVRRSLHGAKVRPGTRGDFSVLVWVRTEAEAETIAKMINDRLLRKPEAETAP